MKNKTALFVESPLQLINAIEAVRFFNFESYRIYIRYSGQKNSDLQIDKILEKFSIDSNILVKTYIKSSRRNIYDLINFVFFYVKFLLDGCMVDRILIGNYDSIFLKPLILFFNKKKIILLDDGSKTISIQDRFSDSNNINLFTIFNVDKKKNQSVFINKYKVLNEVLKNTRCVKKDSILFIGAKLAEANLMSNSEYIMYVTQVASIIEQPMIYVPHRGENINKLESISSISNVRIKYLEYPIELYAFEEGEIPKKVLSFYSTALYTINRLYPSIEVVAYKFNYSNTDMNDELDNIYELYSKEFSVVGLNDIQK